MIGLLGAGLWPKDDEGPIARARIADSKATNRRLRLQHVRRSPPVTIIVVVGGGCFAVVGGSQPRGRSPSLAKPPSSSSFATFFFFFSVLLGVLHPLPGPLRPLLHLPRRQHHLRLLHRLLLRVVSCRAAEGVRQESRTKAGSC